MAVVVALVVAGVWGVEFVVVVVWGEVEVGVSRGGGEECRPAAGGRRLLRQTEPGVGAAATATEAGQRVGSFGPAADVLSVISHPWADEAKRARAKSARRAALRRALGRTQRGAVRRGARAHKHARARKTKNDDDKNIGALSGSPRATQPPLGCGRELHVHHILSGSSLETHLGEGQGPERPESSKCSQTFWGGNSEKEPLRPAPPFPHDGTRRCDPIPRPIRGRDEA